MRFNSKQKEVFLRTIEEIYRSIAGEFLTELSILKKMEIRF